MTSRSTHVAQSHRALPTIACALLLASFGANQQKPDSIEDRRSCFRLTMPGDGWKLLDEHEAKQLSHSASAGAVKAPNKWGVVIAEPANGLELKQAAELLQKGNSARDKVLIDSASIEFLHEPAVRYVLEGNVDGTRIRYDSVVVLHRGFLYQVLEWQKATGAKLEADKLEPFQAAFTFLEGTPRVRQEVSAPKDISGIGWELDDGVYRNAAFGFEAAARAPWRLVVGVELQHLGHSAQIGFACADPSIHAILVAERAVGAEVDALAEASRDRFADLELGADTLTARILGKQVTLREAHAPNTREFEYMCGLVQTSEMVVKVLAWYPSNQAVRARQLLPSGLATTRFLSASEKSELVKRLSALPDEQNQVGATYSLRHGVFEDFAAGVRWTRPAGFWRIKTGDEARVLSPHSELCMQEESLGLTAFLSVTEVSEPQLAISFDAAAKSIFGAEFVEGHEAQSLEVGEVPGLTVSGTVSGKLTLTFDLTMATTKQRIVQLVVSGTPEEMKRSVEVVAAVRAGLQVFSSPVKPVVATSETVRDDRLGYELRSPGEGWRRKHLSLGSSDVHGSATGWWKGKEEIDVWALCPDTEGKDPAYLVQLMSDMLPTLLKSNAPSDVVESSEDFMGQTCKHQSWSAKGLRYDLIFVLKEHTCYMLLSVAEGAGDLKRVEDSFSLVQ